MEKIIGFIGSGNMTRAMVGGMIKSELINPQNIIASSKTKATIELMDKRYGVRTTLDNKEVAKQSDFLIIAVKPYSYEEVLKEIREDIKEGGIIIAIAAGISMGYMEKMLGREELIVKAMPNTPAMVGEGMTALSFSESINDENREEIIKIFNSFGKSEIIDENLMDGFTAIAGSSPAYVYMMIEAMADAGVQQGIPRQQAYKMAAQAVLGAAKMVLDTGLHPGQLKDNVCSPGGTTIDAVAKLEEKGFRTAIIQAVNVCAKKSKEMRK